MRILFVSEYFWPRTAGAEVWAWELCTGLAAHGHEVTVLTLRHDNSPREEKASGVTILRPHDTSPHPKKRVERKKAAARLVKEVQARVARERPDIIHTMAYTVNVAVSRIAEQEGIPCITSVHSYFGDDWKSISPLWPLLRALERRAITRDRGVLHVPSQYLRERIKKDLGKDSTVVHNWLPPELPKPETLPKGTWIFVGSLEPVKNPLGAIREAKRQGARLMVIGTGSQEERVWKEATHAQVQVLSHATHEETLAYIAGASLCVVPSITESFSLVALEAVAQGTPVSGTPVGILPELPGVVAWPPESMPKRIPQKTMREVRKRFSRGAQIRKFEDLYRSHQRKGRRLR